MPTVRYRSPCAKPKTEYSLTEKGRRAIPVISAIREYGVQLMAEEEAGAPFISIFQRLFAH